MKWSRRVRPIDVLAIGAILVVAGFKTTGQAPKVQPSAFAQAVDLSPLDTLAVQADGRLRSFVSHAKSYLSYISGPRAIDGQSNEFSYLDLIFRPKRYADVPMIYVKNGAVREQLVLSLLDADRINASTAADIRRSRLFSPVQLNWPESLHLLDVLGRDLRRSAKQINTVRSAMTVAGSRFLQAELRVIAPATDDRDGAWASMAELMAAGGAPLDAAHAGLGAGGAIGALDADAARRAADAWAALRDAWQAEDADVVNQRLGELASVFPAASSQLYPSAQRLRYESWYYRNNSMTWVWLIYLASVVPLLMSVVYKWDGPRKIGMLLFCLAFAFHTASIALRWYISGRWPNANMFEAVTTAAWTGGVVALILEWVARKTPFRNLFALGSAVASMVALMAAYFLPADLNSAISNKMAALNDVWLYIHTNVIIVSYALIGVAAVTALLQLRHRWCLAWDDGRSPKLRLLVVPIAAVMIHYSGYKLMMHCLSQDRYGLALPEFWAHNLLFAASGLFLVFEVLSARARAAGTGGGGGRYAAVGGAASLILGSAKRPGFLRRQGPTTSQVFDGATMIILELAFVTLWTGVVMGAIWADHSWGRPWGWDPKEVFALNTFIIFIVLIHVRLKVRDKGLWTAVLAVLGFEVMMFNWIAINFIVTGLHSYA